MDEEGILSNIEATETALGLFTEAANFGNAIIQLSGVGGPLLAVIAQLLTMFLASGAQESPELTEIKNVYNRMNTRFDEMSNKLEGVNREIVWSQTHIPFAEIERNIRSNIVLLNTLSDSPPEVRSHYRTEFLNTYASSYDNAGWQLFDAMVNSDHVFETNIPIAVMKYTKNDRQKVQIFMMGIINLIYDCYKLEMAYLQLSNKSIAVMNDTTNKWDTRMATVYTEVLAYDREVESKWASQSQEDFDTLAAEKVDLNNQDFLNQVNDFLVAKYSWRRWFAVVYDDIYGSDNHACTEIGGFRRFLFHGRNVLVASKTKAEPRMNLAYAKSALANEIKEKIFIYSPRWSTTVYYDAAEAYQVNEHILNNVGTYSLFGIVKRNAGLVYTSDGAAISEKYYYIFVLMG